MNRNLMVVFAVFWLSYDHRDVRNTKAFDECAIANAKELISRTQQEIDNEPKQRQLLELLETILVYKFPKMTRKEIELMFGLSDLKQTRVYQEAKQEGRQEGARQEKFRMIPLLLRLGLSIEQAAKELDLSVEEVLLESQKLSQSQDS
ncbi:DUF2887 domain-containing protein [Fischerella thermalis]|uniref:DUF2887 domain-containing protein n=1 Tax=Fischerella thermalis TaxID=372787 RepID=UPI002155EF1B|nr:DUF2887 domain-containing protein [Fischerella thermalis]